MRREFLFIPSALVLMVACGSSAPEDVNAQAAPPRPGETIYKAQCTMCHGRGGDLGLSGAKDLTVSTLTKAEAIAMVTTGKGGMMGYGTQLSKQEIAAVVEHVLTLRKAAEPAR